MDLNPTRILVVEDDEIIALHTRRTLENLGYTVVGRTNRGDKCLNLAEQLAPDLILMDINLDGPLDGIQTAGLVKQRLSIPVVYLTAFSDPVTLQKVKDSGPYGYIVKPFTSTTLRSTIELALYFHQAEKKIQSLSLFPDENPNPVLRISRTGEVLYVNRASSPMIQEWGCSPGQKIPSRWEPWLQEAMRGKKLVVEIPCGESVFSCTWTPIPGADYANLYAYDVTDRHRLERDLRKSEERLRMVVENLPVIVFVVDPEGIIQLSEGKGLIQLGLRPGELVGKSIYAVYQDIPEIGENIRLALNGKKNEATLQVGERIYRNYLSPIVEPDEKIAGVIGVYSDVTDIFVMEQARREGEVRFHRLAEAGFEGLAFTRDGRFLQVNQQFAEMVGCSIEDLIGREVIEFVAPESRAQVIHRIRAGSTEPYEHVAISADGKTFPVEIQIRSIPYGGETIRVIAIRDISQRKKAESSLRDAREQLNLALRAARMGVWDWDLITDHVIGDEVVHAINTGDRLMIDTTIQEILTWIHPEDRQAVENDFYTAARSLDQPFDLEYRVVWRDGSLHTVAIRGNVSRDEDNRAVRMVGVTWDVTERRAIEEEIRSLNANLEQRVSQRTAQLQTTLHELESFSYSVSHDLRSPLRAMNGFSRLLEEDYGKLLDAQALHYIQRIRASSNHMAQLIDDLLNLSRFARANLHVDTVDLSEIAKTVAADLTQADPERTVLWSISDDITARGDSQLLRVVLDNLLGNAWKFSSHTPNAKIEFCVETHAGRQVYVVRDNGTGFDMAYGGKLFGAFQRLHGPNEFEGSGIGLATVQRIIHRHGGDVWAEGEIGKGAAFYFTLP